MRMSQLFLRTLRDDPADAEVDSHRLLVRAGFIRRVSAGIYAWLPLGQRVMRHGFTAIQEKWNFVARKNPLQRLVIFFEIAHEDCGVAVLNRSRTSVSNCERLP